MKLCTRLLAVAAGLLAVNVALAQAPAGSTGQCKDGTYTTATSKRGACRGHKGVQTWFAASAAPASAAASTSMTAKKTKANATASSEPAPSPAPMTAAAPAKSSSHQSMASMAQAPGGGPGMVWVNSSTNVYHCSGSRFYGKTKEGKYMTEAQAKASGARPDHNHPCTK
ncbi:MAG TPA: DUF3761 domain-containing protein [Edaphobacter sp.]|nr:DUF3761 domain-containing protein [Edaphobacter sp.]